MLLMYCIDLYIDRVSRYPVPKGPLFNFITNMYYIIVSGVGEFFLVIEEILFWYWLLYL
jgi:hypothetical protein